MPYINLKTALLVRGMRQYDLARQLEVSESMLSCIIARRREASPEIKHRAARILGFAERWLFAEQSLPVAAGAARASGVSATA